MDGFELFRWSSELKAIMIRADKSLSAADGKEVLVFG
jgi:hypothetical protein